MFDVNEDRVHGRRVCGMVTAVFFISPAVEGQEGWRVEFVNVPVPEDTEAWNGVVPVVLVELGLGMALPSLPIPRADGRLGSGQLGYCLLGGDLAFHELTSYFIHRVRFSRFYPIFHGFWVWRTFSK